MDYLSPTYLINNVSLNLLDTLPASFDFASGWVYALIGLPEQITNSFLSPRCLVPRSAVVWTT